MDRDLPRGEARVEPEAAPPLPVRSPLLSEIGAIVRKARAKRGMTRKALAGLSQTSERYLAQIEGGEGNPTVLVLEAVAQGLGLTLFDLLPLAEGDGARARLARRLRRLSDVQIQAVARFLDGGEAASGAGARGRRIALVGLRGAGKTTLGSALAARLGCPFVELDKLIERDHGAGVAMLFEVYGQATFRRYEREALEKVVASHEAAVIATAGGIVADEDTYALLRATTHVVWLKATPAEHMRRVMEQGDFRPMGRNREAMTDLIAILEAREPEYGRAHVALDTSGRTAEACVEELARTAERLFAGG
ncbi:MAG TPA: helix-turn-helix transcriptional regulator [Beijerinckiaceae bacterium]|jgi:XRE family aerobic/anaerobic benzoate catabolism transcriptional regulator